MLSKKNKKKPHSLISLDTEVKTERVGKKRENKMLNPQSSTQEWDKLQTVIVHDPDPALLKMDGLSARVVSVIEIQSGTKGFKE